MVRVKGTFNVSHQLF